MSFGRHGHHNHSDAPSSTASAKVSGARQPPEHRCHTELRLLPV